MTSNEIILSVIEEDENFKTIKLNEATRKIKINNEDILSMDYDELYDLCCEKWPEVKFKKQTVKDVVRKYARDHKYVPKPKTSKLTKSDWYSKLDFDDKDGVKKTLNNAKAFFQHYPYFDGKFSYNEFTQYETFDGELIKDFNISAWRILMEEEIGFESKDKVETAVQYLTHQNSYNPFKEAIEELVWDGTERLERFFIDTIGGEDTQLTRSETRKWFYALINRLYDPGCAFDSMIITYDSTQGTGKSKVVENLVECLGLSYGYSTSITCDNRDKDNVDKLNKTWIVGIDEMNDFLKKTPEQTKQFLAQRTDQARLSYAKRSEVYQRHCVFYGTSNIEYFLKDYTSGFERRYWIIDCNGTPHDSRWWKDNFPMEYYKQILAEAKYFYDENPNFIYETLSPEETEELSKIQYKHKTLQNDDLLIDKLIEIMDMPMNGTPNSYNEWINQLKYGSNITYTGGDIFTLLENEIVKPLNAIPTKWIKRYISEEIHRDLTTQYITALVKQEWTRKNCTINGINGSYYVRN